jgi:hypothetical protein
MRTKNLVAMAVFVALALLVGSLAFAENASIDGENGKIGEGIDFGGYFFATLGEKIIKIPLSKEKTAANAQFVMDIPPDRYPYATAFYLVDNILYINFYSYMEHGGLFRIDSPQCKPELVMNLTGDENSIGATPLLIKDSKRNPKGLKFFYFEEGDAGRYFWTLYYYLPQKRKTGYLLSKGGVPGELESLAMMSDDGVLDVERVNTIFYDFERDYEYRITAVSKLVFDQDSGKISKTQWLPGKDDKGKKKKMPFVYNFHLSQDETKLFLLGDSLWVYDIKEDSLKETFDFAKFFPKWPNGNLAYVDESYGTNDLSYRFSWSGDNLRVSRDELAITVNAVSGAVVHDD